MGNENSNTNNEKHISPFSTQNPHQMTESQETRTSSDIKTISSQLFQECCLIWHAPGTSNSRLTYALQYFKEGCTVFPFDDSKKAYSKIKMSEIPCFVISSGEDAEAFTNNISIFPQSLSIYIFCQNTEDHKKWAKKNKKIVLVTDAHERLKAAVLGDINRWKRETFHSKIEYSRLYSTLDQKREDCEILSLNLRDLITKRIDDRDEAKERFLNLATALCENAKLKEISEFYHPEMALRWYKEGGTFYKVVDSCLRLRTLRSITHCRLIMSDLQRVIFNIYWDNIQEKRTFHGKLYKGVSMDNIEWETYKRNIGQDIVLTNFLQAEISKKPPSLNPNCNVMVLITVPENVDEEGRGFINISEDKIIFNIFSRFHILAAFTQQIGNGIKRDVLVLRYWTRTEKKQSLKFSVRGSEIICQFCEASFERSEELPLYATFEKRSKKQVFYVNLFGEYVEYICKDCLKKDLPKEIFPLLKISSWMVKSQKRLQATREMERDKLPLSVLFDVKSCSRCNSKNLKRFYQFTDYRESENIWCQSCMEKDCWKHEDVIVYEGSPSSFCNGGAKTLIESAKIYKEAEDSEKAGEDDKALELYHEIIKKNQIVEAETYQKLGRIYCEKKEIEKGEQYFQKALFIMKSVDEEESQIVGEIYRTLGEINKETENFHFALEYSLKALEIIRKNCGIFCQELMQLDMLISEASQNFMKKKREMIRYLREAQEAYEKYSDTHGIGSHELNEYKEKYLERFRLWKEYQDAEEKFPDFVKEMLEENM